MFSSKTLQVFLGIAVFAAISSPTSVLAASNSRRLSYSKSSKKSKSASVTFRSKHDEDDILLASPPEGYVGGSGVVVNEGGGAIGTTHFSCITTKSAPLTALCDAQGCTSAGDDCIYFKARVDLSSGCPSDVSGVVFAGTGMYIGATGTFTTTLVCNSDGTTTDTTEIHLYE